MINFNLKEAGIYQAVIWEGFPIFKFANFLKKLLFGLFCIFLLISPLFSLFFLILSVFFFLAESFFNSKLKNPEIKFSIEEAILSPERFNLAEFLSFEVAKAGWRSIKFAKSKKLSEINSTILFYFLLADNPKLEFIFSRALLNLKEIKEKLKGEIEKFEGQKFDETYSKDFQDPILESLKIAQKKGNLKIGIWDILTALAKYNQIFKKILINFNLKVEDIENLTWWQESLERKIEKSKKFWEHENLMQRGSIARDWAAGYTITLDQFSTEWSEMIQRYGVAEMIGHEKEIAQMERILSRETVNNVLLIGEPGAGRMKIVQELARRVLFNLSSPQINSKRVVSLDIVSILAQSQSQEEAEGILARIFEEAAFAGNVILVIDDFHNYVGQIPQPGIIDISGLISRYLSLPNFQLITVTNYPGFHRFIEPSPVLNFFEKVEISEISERETILVLENQVPHFEVKYKIFIPYPAIRDIVKYSARYLPQIPFPKKAIDLLDEITVYVTRYTKSKIVLPEHVARIISDKTQIPVGEVAIQERKVLLNLEDLLHQRVINQEEGVREVATALRRARADITTRKGPMGCFLFLGPTGVGKTETSKALAEIYFGSEKRMIRLDMSEFQAIKDIPRLIGSFEEEGLLTTPVRENPFSLVLLDEFEKAHPNILNLFLQVFDEGHLTDGLGRKTSFLDTIIIATSNAGYQVILEALKEKIEWSGVKEKLVDFLFKNAIFRPELINRFDAVVVFKPLTKGNLLDIAELLFQKLKKNLKEKEIEFIITQPLKEKIVELGYDPVFGAREMRRVIQDKVENILAQAILAEKLKRGDRVEVEPEKFKLIINPI